MATSKELFELDVEAGSDLSANQYYLVKRTAGQLALCDTAGEVALGVLLDDPAAAGQVGRVAMAGLVKVQVGGTIAQDGKFVTDANGKAVAAATTGHNVLGIMNEAAVDGDIASAMLFGPGTSGVVP